MDTKALDGVSDGLMYLTNGYIEYANAVITGRALPDMRDGLKPVNRRVLYCLTEMKKGFIKSARVVGDTMGKYHPHGDGSIYEAMVLMTDKNGSLAFPTVSGSGGFGGVYKTDKPAAMRYTEVKLHPNSDEYFGEMHGIRMIPNFDATVSEPEVLPVSFPTVLVNSTSGLAVGFKSNIPSFNFNDVCDLVIEYVEKGVCSTVICPDFVTGGYYVRNDRELEKLMKYGVAKLKLRGRVITSGKEINVMEVPFGKTIQGIVKQVNDLETSAIRNAYDTDDFDNQLMFTVTCAAKNRVQEALLAIYKGTDLQYGYNADMTMIVDGMPKQVGVWEVVSRWVKWRRGVLLAEYTYQRQQWADRFAESMTFMNVVNAYDKRMELIRVIGAEGRAAGKQYIMENFTREEVPLDYVDFVASRPLPAYHDGGKYADDYRVGRQKLDELDAVLADIDKVIVRQMKELKQKYGGRLSRRTEVTDTDYEFEGSSAAKERALDNSSCYYVFKDGFLRKLKSQVVDESAQYSFPGYANDTLIAFDNYGRLLRVYCQDIPVHGKSELGTYLPTQYFSLDDSGGYRITWIGRMTGGTLLLLYKDGNIGFVDTSEWVGNGRNVKVLEKGIAVGCADKLGAVLDTIPEVIFVSDTLGRVGWFNVGEMKRKHRTAKTRAFALKPGVELDSFYCTSLAGSFAFMCNLDKYKDRMAEFEVTDLYGKADDFTMM